MNNIQRRKIMFGKKSVIEMDIDPYVSNLDTPGDLKVPTTLNQQSSKSDSSVKKTDNQPLKANGDDEKKENNNRDVEPDEPATKRQR